MAFEEKGEFEIHMETHKTQHTCHCGRSFYTQAALFIHTMGHQNSKGTEPVEVSQMSSTLKLVLSKFTIKYYTLIWCRSALDSAGALQSVGGEF